MKEYTNRKTAIQDRFQRLLQHDFIQVQFDEYFDIII